MGLFLVATPRRSGCGLGLEFDPVSITYRPYRASKIELFKGAYSVFHWMRQCIQSVALSKFNGNTRRHIFAQKTLGRFMLHSDCDGHLTAKECGRLARMLTTYAPPEEVDAAWERMLDEAVQRAGEVPHAEGRRLTLERRKLAYRVFLRGLRACARQRVRARFC